MEVPVLIGQEGPLNGQRWVIDHTTIVGRDPDCDIVLPDRQVSRYHARFALTPQGIFIEDLASKNGTFHNGVRIEEPSLLFDGDLIQVAVAQHFVFLSSDATVPLEFDAMLDRREPKQALVIDPLARRVWVRGEEILPPLSVQQFRLLQVLSERQGEVVERQDLINEIWGEAESIGVTEQAFDALVRRLRERLASLDDEHQFIVTVRGHGLRLDKP